MRKYMTKQRKILLEYLEEHADENISAKQIIDALSEYGISTSAIYRNIAALESENKITRVTKNGSREIYYRFTDSNECKKCIHLSCEKCGKTFHMNIEGAQQLVDNVEKSDMFRIDKANTVLYGLCKKCSEE